MNIIASVDLLYICASVTGITGSNYGTAATNKLTDKMPVAAYSTGKNGGYSGTCLDETAKLNGNRVLVSHPHPHTQHGHERRVRRPRHLAIHQHPVQPHDRGGVVP